MANGIDTKALNAHLKKALKKAVKEDLFSEDDVYEMGSARDQIANILPAMVAGNQEATDVVNNFLAVLDAYLDTTNAYLQG